MKGNNMPGIKEKQFYTEDYNTRDYGTLMHEYEKHLQHNETIRVEKVKNSKEWAKKKAQLRKWTEADQLFEDELWAS
jgi:hypothetical protein